MGSGYHYSGLVDKPTETIKSYGQDKIAETSGEASNPGPGKGKKNPRKKPRTKRGPRMQKRVTNKPLAKGTMLRPQRARVTTGDGWCRIQHSEMLDSILALPDQLFANNLYVYPINPGLYQTFPWLSTQARGFERYRFNQLAFEYVARCPLTLQGAVIMAPDYDPDDVAPQGKKQISTYKHVVEDNVFDSVGCELSVSDMFGDRKNKYNRYGSFNTGSTSIRDYDAGNFYISLVDVDPSITTSGGTLWVHYDVVLQIPRTLDVKTDANVDSLSIIAAGGSISPSSPFGATPTVKGGLGTVVSGSNEFYITKPCNFAATVTVAGTGLFTAFTPTITAVDADGNAMTFGGGSGISNAAANAGTVAQWYSGTMSIVNPPALITIDLTGQATTVTSFHLMGSKFSNTYDEFS